MSDTLEMTQEEIARRLGVDQTRVSRWLSGDRIPRPHTMRRLAAVLGVSVEKLAGEIFRNKLERMTDGAPLESPHSE